MTLLNPSAVHIDEALSEFSLAFMQSADKFVAWRVFPNVNVSKQSNRYWTFPRQYFFTEGFRKKAPGGKSGEVTYEVDNTPQYFCDVWAERTPILHQVRANADRMIDPANLAAKLLTTHAMIKLEKDWCQNFFGTGIWTTQRTGVAGAPNLASEVRVWNDYTNSDPLEDIERLKVVQGELTGYEPNKLVIGRKVWKHLRNHPDIIDRVKYGQTPGRPAEVTRQAVAALMELDEILVTSSVQNTAKQNLSPSYSYIGGNHALLVYAPPSIGWEEPVSAVKFSWDQEAPGTNEQGGAIRTYFNDETETEWADMKMSYDMKVVAPDLGVFIGSVVES
jgi:hypothetical protein